MILIVDYRTPQNEIIKLGKLGRVLLSDKVNALPPINGHPDMQVHVLGDSIFVHKNISTRLLSEISGYTNKNIIVSNYEIRPEYPLDIGLNCVSTEYFLIHNIIHTAQEVLDYTEKKRIVKLHVKQGYTGCSTLVLGSESFITSDKGIFKTLKNNNIDAMYIDSSDIVLNGMSNGFIGGAMKLIERESSKYLVSFGDISNLKESNEIKRFIESKTGDIILYPLSDGPIHDRGGIVVIPD